MNNLIIVAGRITKELELKYTKENKAVLDLPIAINNGKDDTTFLTLTVFGSQAENTHKYCKKGDLIGARGIIKNHNWEDKNGVKHYDYSFIANQITFLQTKAKEESGTVTQKDLQVDDEFAQFGQEVNSEDLPF